MVRLAPGGRHVAFEPLPHLYSQLVTKFPTVDVRCTALADSPGTRQFTHVVSRPAYSGLIQRVNGGEEIEQIVVNVECLDESVPTDYRPTLVKIDVEGAEYQVLRGGRKLLAATRPYIAFEFGAGSAPHYGTTPDDIYRLIEDEIGLRLYDMDGSGPMTRAAFRETYYSGSRFNFLAHA
jgi:FkbM family methyltransferase